MDHGVEGSQGSDGTVRPDRVTGRPRPPRAPAVAVGEDADPAERRMNRLPFLRARTVIGRVRVPDVFGPALEGYRPARGRAVLGLLLVVGLMVYGQYRIDLLGSALGTAALGLLAVVVVLGVVWTATSNVTAGAQWLQIGRRWVETYDLASVRIATGTLTLVDRYRRKVAVSLFDVQADPALWDLVHAGIRDSVERGGADADRATRTMLGLDR